VPKHHVIKEYGTVEVRIPYLLTSVLDAAENQLHAVTDIHLVEGYSSHEHSVNGLAK
jgi:hypothetical protein